MSDFISITVDDDFLGKAKTIRTPRETYVAAKTKDLRNFGYSGLTEKEVADQLQAVLDGGTLSDGRLTIIGSFIENDKPQVIK